MQGLDPMRFQSLTQSLEFQYQALAHGVAQHAEQRRVEIEKEKLERAASAASSWPQVRVVTCKAKILNCSPGPVMSIGLVNDWLNAKKVAAILLIWLVQCSWMMSEPQKVQVWSCLVCGRAAKFPSLETMQIVPSCQSRLSSTQTVRVGSMVQWVPCMRWQNITAYPSLSCLIFAQAYFI